MTQTLLVAVSMTLSNALMIPYFH